MQPSRLSAGEASPWKQLGRWFPKGLHRALPGVSPSPGHGFVKLFSLGSPRREAFLRKEMAFLFRVHFIFKFSVAVAGGRGGLAPGSRWGEKGCKIAAAVRSPRDYLKAFFFFFGRVFSRSLFK